MANETVVKPVIPGIKTEEQRKADISKLFQDIDNNILNAPEDVQKLVTALNGLPVKDLLDADMVCNGCEVVETKKGKTLYKVFSTGFSSVPIKRAGNRTLCAKVEVFIV